MPKIPNSKKWKLFFQTNLWDSYYEDILMAFLTVSSNPSVKKSISGPWFMAIKSDHKKQIKNFKTSGNQNYE